MASGISDIVGKTVREVLLGEAQQWITIYDKVMAAGKPKRFEQELKAQNRVLEAFAFRFNDRSGLQIGVMFLDISERKGHEETQELLLREMDHRVKNLFAITSGVVSLTARSASTPKEMAEKIQGRLRALAGAHQLVRPHRAGAASGRRKTTLG